MLNWIIDISRFFNENMHIVWWIGLFLGAWTVLAEVYRFVHFVYAKLFRKRKNFKQRYGSGKWAFITGSSEGIGKTFAFSLAKQGFNIILAARTQSKLKQVQKQIQQSFPSVQVRYIVVDFIKTNDKKVMEETWYKEHNLQDLDIRVVVNNAGIDFLDKLNDLPLKDIIRMVQLDCFVVTSIMYLFLDKWIKKNNKNLGKQNTKQRFLIINLSSLCAELPISYYTVYNAAKVYVDRLTQACAIEYPEVDFMALRPSEVSTRMTGFKKDIFTIEPHQCVEPLLDDIGFQTVSHGHFVHALQSWIYNTVPFWLFTMLWEKVFAPEFKQIRKNFELKK